MINIKELAWLPPGQRPRNYVCAGCGRPVILVMQNPNSPSKRKVERHARHHNSADEKVCSPETRLHKTATFILARELTDLTQAGRDVSVVDPKGCETIVKDFLGSHVRTQLSEHRFSLGITDHEILHEKTIGGGSRLKPDVQARRGDRIVFFEICVTHSCEDEKIDAGHPIVEIEINRESDIERMIEAVRGGEFLVDDEVWERKPDSLLVRTFNFEPMLDEHTEPPPEKPELTALFRKIVSEQFQSRMPFTFLGDKHTSHMAWIGHRDYQLKLTETDDFRLVDRYPDYPAFEALGVEVLLPSRWNDLVKLVREAYSTGLSCLSVRPIQPLSHAIWAEDPEIRCKLLALYLRDKIEHMMLQPVMDHEWISMIDHIEHVELDNGHCLNFTRKGDVKTGYSIHFTAGCLVEATTHDLLVVDVTKPLDDRLYQMNSTALTFLNAFALKNFKAPATEMQPKAPPASSPVRSEAVEPSITRLPPPRPVKQRHSKPTRGISPQASAEISRINAIIPDLNWKLYARLKTGGQDDWSSAKTHELWRNAQGALEGKSMVCGMIQDLTPADRDTVLRWICRGLRAEHAIFHMIKAADTFKKPIRPSIVARGLKLRDQCRLEARRGY